jgi:hypothetical protein
MMTQVFQKISTKQKKCRNKSYKPRTPRKFVSSIIYFHRFQDHPATYLRDTFGGSEEYTCVYKYNLFPLNCYEMRARKRKSWVDPDLHPLRPSGNHVTICFNDKWLCIFYLWVLVDSQCKHRLFPKTELINRSL